MAKGYRSGFNPFRDAHGRWATQNNTGRAFRDAEGRRAAPDNAAALPLEGNAFSGRERYGDRATTVQLGEVFHAKGLSGTVVGVTRTSTGLGKSEDNRLMIVQGADGTYGAATFSGAVVVLGAPTPQGALTRAAGGEYDDLTIDAWHSQIAPGEKNAAGGAAHPAAAALPRVPRAVVPQTYEGVLAADAYFDREHGAIIRKLPADVARALDLYANGAESMNGLLRRGTGPPIEGGLRGEELRADGSLFTPQGVIQEIDRAFAAIPPLKQPLTVYRGVDGTFKREVWSTLRAGGTFSDKAYNSTSYDAGVAADFGAGQGFLVEIRLAAGQRALQVPSIGANGSEMLLPRGTTYRVVEWSPDGGVLEVDQ